MWGRKKSKYNAVKTADGFPSKLEASVFQMLLLREKAGEISDIRRQHSVHLGFGITWKVDFSFTDNTTKERVYAEAKGIETEGYCLKKRMWGNGAGPGKLEIWKGSYTAPRLFETIIPVKVVKNDFSHGDLPGSN